MVLLAHVGFGPPQPRAPSVEFDTSVTSAPWCGGMWAGALGSRGVASRALVGWRTWRTCMHFERAVLEFAEYNPHSAASAQAMTHVSLRRAQAAVRRRPRRYLQTHPPRPRPRWRSLPILKPPPCARRCRPRSRHGPRAHVVLFLPAAVRSSSGYDQDSRTGAIGMVVVVAQCVWAQLRTVQREERPEQLQMRGARDLEHLEPLRWSLSGSGRRLLFVSG